MKKKSIGGLLWPILSILLTIVSFVFYMINCNTDYFISFGINKVVAACMIGGMVVQILVLVFGWKETKSYLDFMPILSSGLLMAATITFLGSRITEIAFIMTFQKNANTLSDLSSAIIGIACCLIAAIFSIVASFFDVNKEIENETGKIEASI